MHQDNNFKIFWLKVTQISTGNREKQAKVKQKKNYAVRGKDERKDKD